MASVVGFKLPTDRASWTKVLLFGAVGMVLPNLVITVGQQFVASGTVAVIAATMPIHTIALLALFSSDERASLLVISALVLGLGGVFVLAGPDLSNFGGERSVGVLLALAGVLGYAFQAVFVRTRMPNVDAIALSFLLSLTAALVLMPIAIYQLAHDTRWMNEGQAVGSVVTLGIFHSGLNFLLWVWLVRNVGAIATSLNSYLVPVIGVVLGAAVLGESIGLHTVIGMTMVILSLVVATPRSAAGVRAGPGKTVLLSPKVDALERPHKHLLDAVQCDDV